MKKHHYIILGLGVLALTFSALAQKPRADIRRQKGAEKSCAELLSDFQARKNRISREEREQAKADLRKQGCAVPVDTLPAGAKKGGAEKDAAPNTLPEGARRDDAAGGGAPPEPEAVCPDEEPTHRSYSSLTIKVGLGEDQSASFRLSNMAVETSYYPSPFLGYYDGTTFSEIDSFVQGVRPTDNVSPFAVPYGYVRLFGDRFDFSQIEQILVDGSLRIGAEESCPNALFRIRQLAYDNIAFHDLGPGFAQTISGIASGIYGGSGGNHRFCNYNAEVDVSGLLETRARASEERLFPAELCIVHGDRITKERFLLRATNLGGGSSVEFNSLPAGHWNNLVWTQPAGLIQSRW